MELQNQPVLLLDRNNPYYLLNLFSLLSALSVVVILLLVGYGVYRIYSNERLAGAESDAIAVAHTIFGQEQKVLVAQGPDGTSRITLAREDFAALDERMRRYLPPFHIYKIKVFSRDKTIVYSTDHSIIGKVDSGNAKLERVLERGVVISKLESKDEVWDLSGEQRADVDVVETYLPVKVGERIVGSFEVYVDVTHVRERIATVLAWSMAVLFSVLVVVFASLYLPMRRGAGQLKQAQDELRKLASTDMLTGLFNRRYLMARAREEYSRVRRGQDKGEIKGSISFIMADLDHFKQINDSYGHLVGDEVLRAVSARLRSVTRNYDIIGRYGGEEFLIVLPNSGLEDAKLAAERMRREIERTPVNVGAHALNVTVSLGVTCSASGDADEFIAIARADQALYQAKTGGRNRTAWL